MAVGGDGGRGTDNPFRILRRGRVPAPLGAQAINPFAARSLTLPDVFAGASLPGITAAGGTEDSPFGQGNSRNSKFKLNARERRSLVT